MDQNHIPDESCDYEGFIVTGNPEDGYRIQGFPGHFKTRKAAKDEIDEIIKRRKEGNPYLPPEEEPRPPTL